MDLDNLKSQAEEILSSEALNPVEKMRAIDQLIKPNFKVASGLSENSEPTPGMKDFFTGIADGLRKLVRESAWGSENPISFKEAIDQDDLFDEETWDLIESWIDHDRDNNWNYINLVQFNLKNNKKVDGSGFWLSPQHFRMAAIVDTCAREIVEGGNGFDLDLAKSLYKNANQIPQAISSSVSTLRHSA